MRFRVDQGFGETIYVIGVTDNGDLIGVDDDEFTESFNNLSLTTDKNSYSMTMLASNNIKTRTRRIRKYMSFL